MRWIAVLALVGCTGGKSVRIGDSGPSSPSTTSGTAGGTPSGSTPAGTPGGTSSGTPVGTTSSGTPTGTPVGTTSTGTTTPRTDCALPGSRDGTDANTTLDGPASSESGVVLSSGGDLDGDGFDDLVIGARALNTYTGAVYLLYGAATAPASGALSIGFEGNDLNDTLGGAVQIVGDLDGDGFADLAAGASGESGDPSGAISRGGVVHVLYGSATRATGVSSVSTWDFRIHGSDDFAQAGRSLASGDHDGDGLADIAYSIPDLGTASDRGGVFLLHGSPVRPSSDVDDTTLPGVRGVVIYDDAIELGDLDGDGLEDLVLAFSYYDEPYVSVLYGTTGLSGTVLGTDLPHWVDTALDPNGFAQAMALGDTDGDGYADVAVSDHTAAGLAPAGGWVRLVRGSATRPSIGATPVWELVIEGAEADGYVGSALANAGDLDCDGVDDLAVGAMNSDGLYADSGRVGLFWGNPTGTMSFGSADLHIEGDIGGAWFGGALVAGHMDGDPGPELAIGAYQTSGSAGRTYLFLDGFP